MPILFNAPTFLAQPSAIRQSGIRWEWFAKVLLLLLMLGGVKSVFAYSYVCESSSLQSPFPDKIIISAAQDGTVIASGFLVVQLRRCKNESLDGNTSFSVEVPADSVGISLQVAPGITVTSTSLADPLVTTHSRGNSGGICSAGSKNYSGGLAHVTAFHPVGAICTYTVIFPLSLTMHASNGAIAGTVGPDISSRSPSNGASGWVFYSGTNNNFLGLSSALTLIATTCTLSTSNVTVTLPKISTSALNSGAGTTAGRTPFTLALAGCSNIGAVYYAKASWAFAEGAPGTTTIANSASGPASNVYVQLLDGALTPIGNGGASNLATVWAAGSYQTQHYAQYFAGGTAGAGLVKGVATLSLSYE